MFCLILRLFLNIYSNTPIKNVWDAVRKLSGKYKNSPTVHFKTGDGQYAKTS
jgi:hypothetical protein